MPSTGFSDKLMRSFTLFWEVGWGGGLPPSSGVWGSGVVAWPPALVIVGFSLVLSSAKIRAFRGTPMEYLVSDILVAAMYLRISCHVWFEDS